MRIFFLASLSLLSFCCRKTSPPGTPPVETPLEAWDVFSKGADLSYVNQIQDKGGVYRDSGRVKDPYLIFRQAGANTVRLRLWHNPTWQKNYASGPLYSDLRDVTRSIKRAKAAGLAVNLDLHYSDDWADPAKQETPAAWKNLPFNTLRDSVYRYTKEVLEHLKKENAVPEMIQIGNENNSGMLHPAGKINGNDFKPFGQLLQSGIRAVRDFSATATIRPRVILHVAQLQNADWFFKGVTTSGGVTDFDIAGISHYFKWSTIGTFQEVGNILRNLKTQYGKPTMIVETAYPWTAQGADSYGNIIGGDTGAAGYEVSPAGQLRYMQDLQRTIREAGGIGLQYWEPAWITSPMKDRWGTGSSWENCALFDFSGNVLSSMQMYR
jgi:arabinogalactan endo-1,4-beta-galactosidase